VLEDLVNVPEVATIINNLTGLLMVLVVVLAAVLILGIAFLLKKYHYPPFGKFPYKVIYFAPRGTTVEGKDHFVPVFEDKVGVVAEGDNMFLLSKKERLQMPYSYVNRLLGNYLFIRCHNRLEIFPFAPLWTEGLSRKPKELLGGAAEQRDEDLVKIASFTGKDDYVEILSDAPVERYLARQKQTRNQYKNEKWSDKMLPIAIWAVVFIFSAFLLTSLAEHVVSMTNQMAGVAVINEQTAGHISDSLKTIERMRGGYSLPPITPTSSDVDADAPPY